MKQNKPRHPIAVDSETGLYWHGQRVLRSKKLIENIMAEEPRRSPRLHASRISDSALETTGSFRL